MRAFEQFYGMREDFWAFIKYISENLGYTKRGVGVKCYTETEIRNLCKKNGILAETWEIQAAVEYTKMRANLLNNFVEKMLMTGEEARAQFARWHQRHRMYEYQCKLPMNKQKGDMRQIAYFTAMINILAEKTIKEELQIRDKGFDDDPRNLMYVTDENNRIIGASSRRFDGAFPCIENPVLVWEIKEYYYATTFGSRVADGVYETQLDGFEFKEIYNRTGHKIYHVLFIDAYRTWWIQGKSYLCRLVDALNSGVVDEVIVGAEVFERWPELLRDIIYEKIKN